MDKELKEKTYIDRITKGNIILCIFMTIYLIIAGIFMKSLAWLSCASVWCVLAFKEYISAEQLKLKKEIIETQNNVIEELMKRLLKLNNEDNQEKE